MITIGTGGIKPCVTAFGGDQFKLPQQEKQLTMYFSILYFNLCIGSLIAKTVSPILRSDVHCFGEKDCYSLAFGAPGLVVLCSIGKFFWYFSILYPLHWRYEEQCKSLVRFDAEFNELDLSISCLCEVNELIDSSLTSPWFLTSSALSKLFENICLIHPSIFCMSR